MVCAESYRATFSEDGNRRVDARVQETIPSGAIVTTMAAEQSRHNGFRTNSPPYKRQTYFSERISQWRMLEPIIDGSDLRTIEREWNRLTGKHTGKPDPFFADSRWYRTESTQQQLCTHILTKEGCRKMLWHIDNNLRRYNEPAYFVKKYLEKYFSIRKHLCHMDSTGLNVDGDLLMFLHERFAALQAPFNLFVRSDGVRYSFPNYNFCLRRLFDLYGTPECCWDFPPLKSKRKREDIVHMWLKLVRYLQWPYINSDGKHWGSAYHTDIVQLANRRSRRNHPPARAHTDDSSAKLRWGLCEDTCEEADSNKLWNEAFLDFPSAFLCAPVCDLSWGGDDGDHTVQ